VGTISELKPKKNFSFADQEAPEPAPAPKANFGFDDIAGTEFADPKFLAAVVESTAALKPEAGTLEGAELPGSGPEHLEISEEQRKTLATELCELLERYDTAMEERWAREREIEDAYELMLNNARSGNYQGAASLPSEMTMAAVDQAHARVTGTIQGVTPMMRVEAVPSSMQPHDVAQERADAMERFLEVYARRKMGLDDYLPIALLRTCKVGTSVTLLEWEESSEPYYAYREGRLEKKARKWSGARPKLIRNSDVILWPYWVQDWQKAEVVGHREVMTVSEWRRFAKDRKIDRSIAERAEAYAKGEVPPENMTEQAKRSNIDLDTFAASQTLVRFANLWCYRYLPDEYEPIKYQVIIHEGLREIIWIDHNRLHSQKHPYYPIRYKRVDGSGWGVGVGQEIFPCQMADEGFRNIGMDNLLSSAFSVILTKSGSIADSQIDRAYPGQKISTDDLDKDFATVSLADNGPISLIYQAQQDNEMRKMSASGLAAVLSGQGDPTMKSGAGTGSTMALIEQAGKKFGMIDSYVRADLSPLFVGVVENVAQFASEGVFVAYADPEDAQKVQEVRYTPPQGDISEMFRISVRAPSAANNREMQKQGALVAYNFLLQHANMLMTQGVPVLQQSNAAAVPEWQSEILNFTIELGNRILELSDVPDLRLGLPTLPEPTPQDQQINDLTQQLQQAQQQLQGLQQQLQQLQQPPGAPSGGQQATGTPLPAGEDAPPSAPAPDGSLPPAEGEMPPGEEMPPPEEMPPEGMPPEGMG
jgi:hypothetical protein